VSGDEQSQRRRSQGGAAAGRRSWSDLGPRLLSAIVLVPVVIIAVFLGGYLLAIVAGAAFAGAYREWDRMVTLRDLDAWGVGFMALVVVGAVLYPAFGAPATLGVSIVAAVIALIRGGGAGPWRAGGLVYIGIVIVALLSMRGSGEDGIWAGVVLGVTVWLTDTGAFFAGRRLGGHKLAPDISPAKTWSGALGGLVIGTVCGSVVWYLHGGAPLWIGVVLCALISISGQIGDLAESALKRRFRVKDSGDIIPGHGGLMDRLDSLTFGALFLYVVGALHMGQGAVAAGFLNW
jgi:phosphatidate cytidylyltransferase